jgi:hypothetical protein
MSNKVTSSRYNQLRQRIQMIMGNSTNTIPQFGYGQTISSEAVIGSQNQTNLSTVNKISAQDYRNLYLDLARARIHQIGSLGFSQTAFPIGNFLSNSNADKIELQYIEALEGLMTQIENDKFLINSNQAEIVNLNLQSTRSLRWGGSNEIQAVSHRFTVTFNSVQSCRHFFNSGGQIRIQASLDYNGGEAKTQSWKKLLSDIGIIIFTATNTTSTGQGSGSNTGYYSNLTSSQTQIFNKSDASVYSNNNYRLFARLQSQGRQIEFTAEFTDGLPLNTEFGIDESVLGTLRSGPVHILRANGSATINGINTNTVVITETPSSSTISNL